MAHVATVQTVSLKPLGNSLQLLYIFALVNTSTLRYVTGFSDQQAAASYIGLLTSRVAGPEIRWILVNIDRINADIDRNEQGN